ncbi:desmocollin-1-like [Tiliqua scincoides]|uniref:desmocollin-1-like n=1 Tax=Tiliqua scincoides TaxID=71010 RepID=UPI0034633EC5
MRRPLLAHLCASSRNSLKPIFARPTAAGRRLEQRLSAQPPLCQAPCRAEAWPRGQAPGSSSSSASCYSFVHSKCLPYSFPIIFFLQVLSLHCEACKEVTFNVSSNLEAWTLIGRVNLEQCLGTSDLISSSDPDFLVVKDGSVYTTNAISLSSEEKAFTVFLNDHQEQKQKKIHINLLSHPVKTHKTGETILRRTKRRWAPVPTSIMENSLGPFPMQIQQLVSDTAQRYSIVYSISGPGVDQPPLNYFYIEKETGNLFVTCPIDREEYAEFKIICYARTVDGYTPELPLQHIIRIEDDNDNPPIFEPETCTFSVYENSRSGTIIGQMTATDRDEIGTLHTKLKYRIVSQDPPPFRGTIMFSINSDTGSIVLVSPLLDREVITTYIVLVEARDMGGQAFGLCNTGTAVIQIEDTNDHAPRCEHSTYEVYVSENTVGAKVVDITILDNDAPGTPAWQATVNIIKGNEDGAFKIDIDQNSNIGTLCIEKGLDYEKNRERRLEIVVNNEAPYVLGPNSRAISTSTCYVIVKVRDVDEGPIFNPPVYIINVKECLPAGTVVGRYLASDPESGNSMGIRYGILNDPCNWITIDNEGEIRTTAVLDRDAPNMINQCNVTVIATDQSGKTGTGVVVVNLEDENDNFPVIVKREFIMCNDRQPICLTAVDADLPHNGAPFKFESLNPRWSMVPNDETSAYLTPEYNIPYGVYDIPVRVIDRLGHEGITEVRVVVCDCTTPSDCRYRDISTGYPGYPGYPRQPGQTPSVSLGIWAILAMVLGSLLLLLILITLCGCCGAGAAVGGAGKQVCDDLAGQSLITSNTEGLGATAIDTNILPVKTGTVLTCEQGADMSAVGVKGGNQECFEMVDNGGHQVQESFQTLESTKGGGQQVWVPGRGYRQSMMDIYRYSYSDWQNFTRPYLIEQVHLCGLDEENKYSEDYVHSYNYEGRGSPAGSVGCCCSDQEDEEELDFLERLDPKFRTLAETCIKR